MTYVLEIADEHVVVLAQALKALRDIHVGDFNGLAAIPSLAGDTEAEEFASRLSSLCPLVTGEGPGHFLPLASKLVPDDARIAHDYYTILLAILTGGSADNTLVSGQVSDKQISFAQGE